MSDNSKPEQLNGNTTRIQTALRVGLVLVVSTAIVAAVVVITWNKDWSSFFSFDGIIFWNWLGLLIVPFVLASGGLLFSRAERKNERQIADRNIKEERTLAAQRIMEDRALADDRTHDIALREYLDRMSALLLEHKLAAAKKDGPVGYVARARTLTILRTLGSDGSRKGSVVQFLYETGLIKVPEPTVSLSGANLIGASLIGANLIGADLIGANLNGSFLSEAYLMGAFLNGADLSGADLSRTNLSGADLSGANLNEANLNEANLNRADLSGATVTEAQLNTVLHLEDAIMPNFTKHY